MHDLDAPTVPAHQPRRAGYLAALLGLTQADNPHPADTQTTAWHLWDEGYQECCREGEA